MWALRVEASLFTFEPSRPNTVPDYSKKKKKDCWMNKWLEFCSLTLNNLVCGEIVLLQSQQPPAWGLSCRYTDLLDMGQEPTQKEWGHVPPGVTSSPTTWDPGTTASGSRHLLVHRVPTKEVTTNLGISPLILSFTDRKKNLFLLLPWFATYSDSLWIEGEKLPIWWRSSLLLPHAMMAPVFT